MLGYLHPQLDTSKRGWREDFQKMPCGRNSPELVKSQPKRTESTSCILACHTLNHVVLAQSRCRKDHFNTRQKLISPFALVRKWQRTNFQMEPLQQSPIAPVKPRFFDGNYIMYPFKRIWQEWNSNKCGETHWTSDTVKGPKSSNGQSPDLFANYP